METVDDDYELVVGASKLSLNTGEEVPDVERKIAVADGGWYTLLLTHPERNVFEARYQLLKGQTPDDNRVVVAGELRGGGRRVYHSKVKPMIGGSNTILAYNVEYVVYIPRGVITVTAAPGCKLRVGELSGLIAKRDKESKSSDSPISVGTQSE